MSRRIVDAEPGIARQVATETARLTGARRKQLQRGLEVTRVDSQRYETVSELLDRLIDPGESGCQLVGPLPCGRFDRQLPGQ